MDQDAFRQTYREVNERFCAYEKAILTNQCGCRQSEKFCIAEREGVHCLSDEGQHRCLDYLEILREQAQFALRSVNDDRKNRLPHGKAIRVQVGGIRGLEHVLEPHKPAPEIVSDIYATLDRAIIEFGSIREFPFANIMPQIAAYKNKTRSRRRKRDKD
jgi:hypothetical protein